MLSSLAHHKDSLILGGANTPRPHGHTRSRNQNLPTIYHHELHLAQIHPPQNTAGIGVASIEGTRGLNVSTPSSQERTLVQTKALWEYEVTRLPPGGLCCGA